MPLRARSRASVPAPVWWSLFAAWMGLDDTQAARLWGLVTSSRHPEVRAWCTTVRYIRGAVGDRAYIRAIIAGPLAPRRIVGVLEILVEEGTLTRQEATAMEERVFQQIDRHGAWT